MGDRVKFGSWVTRIFVSSIVFLSAGVSAAHCFGVSISSGGYDRGFYGVLAAISFCFAIGSGVIVAGFIEDYINHRVKKHD